MPRGQLNVEQRLRQRVTRLTNENARLRSRMAILEQENASLKAQMGDILVRLEELQRKVFGRKKKTPPDEGASPPAPHSPRPPASYRRRIPQPEAVTAIRQFSLERCLECHTPLRKKKIVVRYEEDILDPKEWPHALKITEQHLIETGWCSTCRKRVRAVPIPSHVVTLGNNIKRFVPYLSVIQRMSFDQIRNFLRDSTAVSLSDGEVSNILEDASQKLAPRFEHLKVAIAKEPGAHYDETSWKTQNGVHGNFAWVKTGTTSPNAIFLLGRSRGKGNALELRGDGQEQIGVTDDYGAYDKIFQNHQLCFAHPLRKLRELKESEHLTAEERTATEATYEAFAAVYEHVRRATEQPFDLAERTALTRALEKEFRHLTHPCGTDPPKLKRIKQTLRENEAQYFTCLMHAGIPPDNNKAERALRHLVLKRKISFGSKTQKGADAMSILHSVLLSLWWRRPVNFFAEYTRLFAGQ